MAPRKLSSSSSPTSDEAEDLAEAQPSASKNPRRHQEARGKAPRTLQQPAAPVDESKDNQAAENAGNIPRTSSRLKTSKEVYDLVRTDPGYDAQKCHIVYHDRVANRYMRTALADWTPASAQGDVPWHRVWFFTYDGTVFWDRERRCFDHALLRRLASGDAVPSYKNVTRGAQSVAETLPRDFRLATLSLLDAGHGRREESASDMISKVSATLRDLDADVIMLQECEESTREFFEEQDWVRGGYEVVYSDLEPCGKITLARAHHTRASQHFLSASNKRALRVCFKTDNGVDVETWNADLKSSTVKGCVAGTADQRRSGKEQSGTEPMSQLEQWTHIAGIYPAIVAGKVKLLCVCANNKSWPIYVWL